VHDPILFERQNQYGLITLNRQEALNALSLDMIQALKKQLVEWEKEEAVKAVIIRAAEGRVFCAGGDVRWLYQAGKDKNPQLMAFFEQEYHLNKIIHDYSKPYIALMNGLTVGGGVGISLHGSHTVASERFAFAMPETSIGFFPDIGGSYLLSKCPGAVGFYLGLTGNRLSAMESLACGLVNAVVSSDTLDSLLQALLATNLTEKAHQEISQCIAGFAQSGDQHVLPTLQGHVDTVFSLDTVESMVEALACNEDDWSKKTAQILLSKSPTSLKVTHLQLQKARSLSFDDCMAMDARLVRYFMAGHDFYEGVRALLIDKDNKPQWKPESLADIRAEAIAQYF